MNKKRSLGSMNAVSLGLNSGDISGRVLIDGASMPLVMPADQPRTTFVGGINPWMNIPQTDALMELGYVVAR